MRQIFTVEELINLGFEKVEDSPTYLQYILNKNDYFSSNFIASEDVWNLESGMELRVSASGDENWLGEEELLAIIKRGYL
jgi:hypothetical protein